MRATGPERGSMTVLALAAGAVLLILTLAGAQLVAAAVAAHQARSAADLAALAGAGAAQEGPSRPCAAAADVATRNGADLTGCAVAVDGSVLLAVRVPVALRLPGGPAGSVARARAGPAP